jgi:hypothetical protein
VPSYRIYKLSPENRIVGIPDQVEFASDQDVIADAKAKLDGLDIEVWDGPRVVIRLKRPTEYSAFIKTPHFASGLAAQESTPHPPQRNTPALRLLPGELVPGRRKMASSTSQIEGNLFSHGQRERARRRWLRELPRSRPTED